MAGLIYKQICHCERSVAILPAGNENRSLDGSLAAKKIATAYGLAMTYFVLFVFLMGLTGCGKAPAPTMPVSTVQLIRLSNQTVTESTQYLASLVGRRSVTLQPRVDGQISVINVQPGDVVKAGQVLMQLDARQQQASLLGLQAAEKSSEQSLMNGRQSLSALQATRQADVAALLYAKQQYDRYTTLYAENSTSKQLLDQYTDQYNQAKATLKQDDAKINAQKATLAGDISAIGQARANISGQQSQVGYYTITAPFDGVVGDIPVKLGAYVSQQTSLVTLTDNRTLEINLSVSMEQAARLRMGMPLQLEDADNKILGRAHVFFIATDTTADSQTVLIKARYDNSKGSLRADQVVRARVIWATRPNVTIPVLAVTHNANLSFVYKPVSSSHASTGMVAQMVPIEVGDIVGSDYVVKSGLHEGDEVITTGVQSVIPNMPIKVMR